MSTEGKRIVDDLSSEDVTELLTDIYEYELPPVLQELVEEYQELEHARPPFMWKWVHRLAPQNTLPCVDEAYTDQVPTDKTIAIMFITLIDDLLERGGDRETFRKLARIPLAADDTVPGDDESDYVAFTRHVWETLIDRIRRGPAYGRYADLFHFDVKQAINAIEYSDLVIQNPGLATVSDLDRYESHNMVMFAYADIDLMHTTRDVADDYPALRRAVWHAQLMARIGNWLSTWERELAEGDYSAGVVIAALERSVITQADLRGLETGEIAADDLATRIREDGIEEMFLHRWDDNYRRLEEINGELTTMDLAPFIEGMEEVLRYHMASTGLK